MAHNTFVLKVTDEHGKEELHGCGVAPFVTAEMVAQHLGDLGHFTNHDPRQKMPRVTKVTILHRSHLVRKTLDNIHTVKALPKVEFVVDKDANNDLKNLAERESAAASNQPETVAKPQVAEEATDETIGKPPRADERPAVEIGEEEGEGKS
jgi:hypothetical protein